MNVLSELTRDDKWYLGGGGRLLWAPPFPRFLDRPGFWDQAHYFNYAFGPLFTWCLLDANDTELPLRFQGRTWNPAYLSQRYTTEAPAALEILERKAVAFGDTAASEVTLENRTAGEQALHFVAWTVQTCPPNGPEWLSDLRVDDRIAFVKHLRPPGCPPLEFAAVLSLEPSADSLALKLSEGRERLPEWRFTPFYESFADGLPEETELDATEPEGLLFLALHRRLVLAPGERQSVRVRFAVAPTLEAVATSTSEPERQQPVRSSLRHWRRYFAGLPRFECSDPYFTRAYWYRWYGLRLNTVAVQEGRYRHPFVCEGIDYFRAPIAYSAPCHVLENRWQPTPELATGTLLTFVENQRENGAFPGYLDVRRDREDFFYHAHWGWALRALWRVHPSSALVEQLYEPFKRYAEYFDRERDPERYGLYDIHNHYETGQEYMSRYLAVSADADRVHWGKRFRLKGVDVTVYLYELKRTLAEMAAQLGRDEEAQAWRAGAEKIKQAVLEHMWDPQQEMFFDVNPAEMSRTRVKAAACFYPYFTDIVSRVHLPGLERHLFNPQEFWTPFPAPATSADDPYFSATPEWKGKRMNCPWNGRVWPMANSHLAEALGQAAIRFEDEALRLRTADFITRFVRMLFFDRDPRRPNGFEHYHPFTGKPSLYRGIDDYQHSWVVDLLVRYLCGVRPEPGAVVVDPFPFDVEGFEIDALPVQGHTLKVARDGDRFHVWLDGQAAAEGKVGEAATLSLA